MFTIKYTRSTHSGNTIRHLGTFTDENTAGGVAVRMLDSGLFDGICDFDTIPIADGITPEAIPAWI